MQLFINPRSGVPLYRQLMQQLKTGIAAGILKPGERLPTVREVALELTINPNTVARAYKELEMEGLLSTVQGRGTFIKEAPLSSERGEEIFREKVRRLIHEGRQIRLSPKVMKEIFLQLLEKEEKNESE